MGLSHSGVQKHAKPNAERNDNPTTTSLTHSLDLENDFLVATSSLSSRFANLHTSHMPLSSFSPGPISRQSTFGCPGGRAPAQFSRYLPNRHLSRPMVKEPAGLHRPSVSTTSTASSTCCARDLFCSPSGNLHATRWGLQQSPRK